MFTSLMQVEWETEKDCFETFARETADFFAIKSKWLSTAAGDNGVDPKTTAEVFVGTSFDSL